MKKIHTTCWWGMEV